MWMTREPAVQAPQAAPAGESAFEQRRRREPGVKLERRADGLLWAVGPEGAREVTVSRCFPWSEPGRFISLRSRDEEEVLLVRDVAELDEGSRVALERSLLEAGFVLEIERVLEIDEEIEIRSWRVITKNGPRRFQTPRDEWPRPLPGGGLLVRDVAGDLFHIREPGRLDPASRRKLWAFVD